MSRKVTYETAQTIEDWAEIYREAFRSNNDALLYEIGFKVPSRHDLHKLIGDHLWEASCKRTAVHHRKLLREDGLSNHESLKELGRIFETLDGEQRKAWEAIIISFADFLDWNEDLSLELKIYWEGDNICVEGKQKDRTIKFSVAPQLEDSQWYFCRVDFSVITVLTHGPFQYVTGTDSLDHQYLSGIIGQMTED